MKVGKKTENKKQNKNNMKTENKEKIKNLEQRLRIMTETKGRIIIKHGGRNDKEKFKIETKD